MWDYATSWWSGNTNTNYLQKCTCHCFQTSHSLRTYTVCSCYKNTNANQRPINLQFQCSIYITRHFNAPVNATPMRHTTRLWQWSNGPPRGFWHICLRASLYNIILRLILVEIYILQWGCGMGFLQWHLWGRCGFWQSLMSLSELPWRSYIDRCIKSLTC